MFFHNDQVKVTKVSTVNNCFIPLHYEKKCVVLLKIMDKEYKNGPSEEKDQ